MSIRTLIKEHGVESVSLQDEKDALLFLERNPYEPISFYDTPVGFFPFGEQIHITKGLRNVDPLVSVELALRMLQLNPEIQINIKKHRRYLAVIMYIFHPILKAGWPMQKNILTI